MCPPHSNAYTCCLASLVRSRRRKLLEQFPAPCLHYTALGHSCTSCVLLLFPDVHEYGEKVYNHTAKYSTLTPLRRTQHVQTRNRPPPRKAPRQRPSWQGQ